MAHCATVPNSPRNGIGPQTTGWRSDMVEVVVYVSVRWHFVPRIIDTFNGRSYCLSTKLLMVTKEPLIVLQMSSRYLFLSNQSLQNNEPFLHPKQTRPWVQLVTQRLCIRLAITAHLTMFWHSAVRIHTGLYLSSLHRLHMAPAWLGMCNSACTWCSVYCDEMEEEFNNLQGRAIAHITCSCLMSVLTLQAISTSTVTDGWGSEFTAVLIMPLRTVCECNTARWGTHTVR